MGKPEEWVGTALLAQPFYREELRMIGLLAPALRVGLLGLIHPCLLYTSPSPRD